MTSDQVTLLEQIRQCAPEQQMKVWALIDEHNKALQENFRLRQKIKMLTNTADMCRMEADVEVQQPIH